MVLLRDILVRKRYLGTLWPCIALSWLCVPSAQSAFDHSYFHDPEGDGMCYGTAAPIRTEIGEPIMAPPPNCGATYYLDANAVPQADLVLPAPTGPILANHDPWRDVHPGTVIQKGGSGLNETDPTKFQLWQFADPPVPIDGEVTLRIWTAMKDLNTGIGGSFTVYLSDCLASGNDCVPIATRTVARSDWDTADTGSWIEEVIEFGSMAHLFGPGRRLFMKVIVNNASADDMWFAYDAVPYPSRLVIGPGTDGMPVINCPENITVNTDAGSCSTVVTYPTPVGFSACTGWTTTLVTGLPSGSTFPIGTTTNLYRVTDAGGFSRTCSFTVTVIDAESPIIDQCPTDITLSSDAGLCGAIVSWPSPVASDNCSVVLAQTGGIANGAEFPTGTTLVTYTATDPSGNAATCTFNVTVLDGEAPVILNCLSDTSVISDPNSCGAVVNWTEPTAIDNCAASILQTTGPPSGSTFPIGTTLISYLATDSAGNNNTCSFTITILDAQPLTIENCPVDTTVIGNSSDCGAFVSWADPIAIDNCAGASITQTGGPSSGSLFQSGVTTIVYTATNSQGDTTTCSFAVTVLDEEPPVVTDCPADIQLNAQPGSCGAIASWDPPSMDEVCTGTTLVQTIGAASGSTFPIGTSQVAYVATDASGNTSTCSFSITVIDTEAPVFTACPADVLVGNDPDQCGAVVSWDPPTSSDLCSSTTISLIQGPPSGSTFPLGVTMITYQAVDEAGNSSQCSFTVTVEYSDAPVILGCLGNFSVPSEPGDCGANVTWTEPTVDLTCPNATITQTAGPPNGSFLTVGTTVVTYTALDDAGNSSICSFNITVLDQEAPVFSTCPSNISLSNDPGLCGASVAWTAPFANDNCSGVTVTQTSGAASGSFFPVGTTTITYTATDASGNTSACSFTITIIDDEAPLAICTPTTIFLDELGSATLTPDQIDGGSSDNCGIVDQIVAPNVFTTPGIHPVTLNVIDAAGNSSTCTTEVEVIVPVPPIAICQDVIVYLDGSGEVSIDPQQLDGGSFDPDGTIMTSSIDRNSFSCDDIGDQWVTLTITDDDGLAATCVSTITVLDTISPSVVCANLTIELQNGEATIGVADVLASVSDNCGEASLTLEAAPINFFTTGDHFVTLTATDQSGNSASCVAIVSIPGSITENELIIPSGFSPNGDGIADLWEIQGLAAYPGNSITIFNRWGSELWKASPYGNDWNGTADGEVPAGVYFYQLDLGNGEEPVSGYIQLNR